MAEVIIPLKKKNVSLNLGELVLVETVARRFKATSLYLGEFKELYRDRWLYLRRPCYQLKPVRFGGVTIPSLAYNTGRFCVNGIENISIGKESMLNRLREREDMQSYLPFMERIQQSFL